MKNWKTSLVGILGSLFMIFGPRLSGDHSAPPVTLDSVGHAAAFLLLGLMAKDSNVTGGTTPQDGGTIPADPKPAER